MCQHVSVVHKTTVVIFLLLLLLHTWNRKDYLLWFQEKYSRAGEIVSSGELRAEREASCRCEKPLGFCCIATMVLECLLLLVLCVFKNSYYLEICKV